MLELLNEMSIMELLYELWDFFEDICIVLAVISVAIGLWPGIVILKKIKNKIKNKLWAWLAYIMVGISYLLISSVILLVLGSLYTHMMSTRVPKVVNMTLDMAIHEIEAADLDYNVESEQMVSEELWDYRVIKVEPAEGKLVKKEKIITIFLDETIEEGVIVPYLVGASYQDVVVKLEKMGLCYRIISLEEFGASLELAYVKKQSIMAGIKVPKGSIIELQLYVEPEKLKTPTPSLVMTITPSMEPTTTPSPKPRPTATTIPSPTSTPQPTFTPTPIMAQMILVPNVLGMEMEDAIEVLENNGLRSQEWWFSGLDRTLEIYYVGHQSIPGNSIVPAGTVIKLERREKNWMKYQNWIFQRWLRCPMLLEWNRKWLKKY